MSENLDSPQRDAARTREAILRAAQSAFSQKGYSAAGVREITTAAGVNPALISRYYGSKENLYREALADLMEVDQILSGPLETMGQNIVDRLLQEPGTLRNPLPMMVLASADPVARAITNELLEDMVLEPLTRWFGEETGRRRATEFMILSSGLTIYANIYPLSGVAPVVDPAIRNWLSDIFQKLFT